MTEGNDSNVWNQHTDMNNNNSRMYRSLGYIPQQLDNEAYQDTVDYQTRTSSRR